MEGLKEKEMVVVTSCRCGYDTNTRTYYNSASYEGWQCSCVFNSEHYALAPFNPDRRSRLPARHRKEKETEKEERTGRDTTREDMSMLPRDLIWKYWIGGMGRREVLMLRLVNHRMRTIVDECEWYWRLYDVEQVERTMCLSVMAVMSGRYLTKVKDNKYTLMWMLEEVKHEKKRVMEEIDEGMEEIGEGMEEWLKKLKKEKKEIVEEREYWMREWEVLNVERTLRGWTEKDWTHKRSFSVNLEENTEQRMQKRAKIQVEEKE